MAKVADRIQRAYREALEGRETRVTNWFQHFGLSTNLWRSERFSPWRELWNNQLVCSAAIHRRIFEGGLWYDEHPRLMSVESKIEILEE